MSTLSFVVDEIGELAAASVEELLQREEGSAWAQLVKGGWTELGSDEPISVRDLQEIARVAGRSIHAHTLVPSLLLVRWGLQEGPAPASGVTFAATAPDGSLLVPYCFDDVIALDLTGSPVPMGDVEVDDFASVMPLGSQSDPGHSPALSGQQLADTSALVAAVMVGCADEAALRAIAWSQTREQFGQSISKFQAVRHHLANMHVARELAWSAAIAAGHQPDAAVAWAQTAGQRAMDAIQLSIQVHGGVGFTAEVGLHHFLNHVLELRQLLNRLNPAAQGGGEKK